jgi:hypothetical protein
MSDKIVYQEMNGDIDLALYSKLLDEMEHNAVGVVSKPFQDIFEKFPEVKAITWTQYAPYFNDGDPCYFSVHEMNFKLSNDAKIAAGAKLEDIEVDEDYDDEDEDYDFWESDIPYSDKTSALAKAQTDLNTFADKFQNIFEKAFGDDCAVIATRDGFETREYNHD